MKTAEQAYQEAYDKYQEILKTLTETGMTQERIDRVYHILWMAYQHLPHDVRATERHPTRVEMVKQFEETNSGPISYYQHPTKNSFPI